MQFLFATDRGNMLVADRFDALNPAALMALRAIVEGAERHNVPLNLCGEMAGKPLEAMALIGLGFRSISMAPASVGPVKAMILSLDAGDLWTRLRRASRVQSHVAARGAEELRGREGRADMRRGCHSATLPRHGARACKPPADGLVWGEIRRTWDRPCDGTFAALSAGKSVSGRFEPEAACTFTGSRKCQPATMLRWRSCFGTLRAASDLSEADLAGQLATRIEVVQALEQGALFALPPWPETCRVVATTMAPCSISTSARLLRRIYAQVEAGHRRA